MAVLIAAACAGGGGEAKLQEFDAFRPAGIDVQRTEIATVDVAFGGKIAGRSA